MRRWLGVVSFLVLLLCVRGADDRALEELVLYAGAGIGAVLLAVVDKKLTLRDSDSRAQTPSRKRGTKLTEREGSKKQGRKNETKSTEREGTHRVVAHSPPPHLSPHRTALSPHPPPKKAISPLPRPDPACLSSTPDWHTYENCTLIGIRKSVK
ncbi:hypothetical protein PRIPAC_79336 [Pristionchus pacificus]|uniref:Uncharacterized protein n=1 Tax=Pristionchus pacificus TaxID=54126 RepID=A0A2A6BW12_PRIPA|nr:hypothetical protein PRIPAC_79336 [Pristionchus pacificus]|eukprot:PDM70089.1 hypothetical protein PRIPAC_49301 [Pristionchus pacificus]